jgi:predicted O-methyltransferase YrrM
MLPAQPTFEQLCSAYENSAEHNDELHRRLTAAAWAEPLLAEHRRHVEKNDLGFGDPAFHAMWLRLLEAASRRFGTVRVLEIGVFKGQVISLWSLLARERGIQLEVSALSPLTGQPAPRSVLINWFRYRLSRRFREKVDNGNFYANADYAAVIRQLFDRFGLEFDRVRLYRGFSTDPNILRMLEGEKFHLIYVDGDHTYEGALHDFTVFGPKVLPGGWLVADDAGHELPGSGYWKGHESVSRATRALPALGFKNVLNVGHNRIFERVAS